MKLKCLGSNSDGNCYILEDDTEALIIEAGISFKEVKKALNFNVSKIVGVVISHIHKDHSKYHNDYKLAGINVFEPYENETYGSRMGNFNIHAFKNYHDVPCFGYYITHPEIGSLVFATDTRYVKYKFPNVNHIMIEANWSDKYLNRSDVKYKHVVEGHMNIDTTCDFIKANNNLSLKDVMLIHLSDGSSNENEFLEMAKSCVADNVNVYVADKGLEIEL